MPKINILWTKEAEEHIKEHGIRKYEVDNAISGKIYTKTMTRHGERRIVVIGESRGRILLIVLKKLKDNQFIIRTAYDAPNKMKKLYKKKVTRR